jgi:hypothetical protein
MNSALYWEGGSWYTLVTYCPPCSVSALTHTPPANQRLTCVNGATKSIVEPLFRGTSRMGYMGSLRRAREPGKRKRNNARKNLRSHRDEQAAVNWHLFGGGGVVYRPWPKMWVVGQYVHGCVCVQGLGGLGGLGGEPHRSSNSLPHSTGPHRSSNLDRATPWHTRGWLCHATVCRSREPILHTPHTKRFVWQTGPLSKRPPTLAEGWCVPSHS